MLIHYHSLLRYQAMTTLQLTRTFAVAVPLYLARHRDDADISSRFHISSWRLRALEPNDHNDANMRGAVSRYV